MKRYLVFAGECYYPSRGWIDYRGSYETHLECVSALARMNCEWWQIVDRDTAKILEWGDRP